MSTLEELLAIIKFKQEQRFTQIETFTSLIRGKTLIGVAEASTRTKGIHTMIPIVLTIVVVDDSSLVIKKVELSDFECVDPVGWLAHTEQYFAINNAR